MRSSGVKRPIGMSGQIMATFPAMPVDQDVLSLAQERVKKLFDLNDYVMVAFSGGKDSTAALQLCLAEARSRNVRMGAFFGDEECIPIETEQYVRRTFLDVADICDTHWLALPVKCRNACSRQHPHWWPWAPEARDVWARDLPDEAVTTLPGFPTEIERRPGLPECAALIMPPKLGRVAQVLGVRADESLTRSRNLRRNVVDNWICGQANDGWGSTAHISRAFPIYDWRRSDVWTAPAQFGWDYNRAYDIMEMAGIGAQSQRCSPAFGEEPLQKLAAFKTCFPDVWERMTERVPGVQAAARYATTELYGFHGTPQKPADQSWPDFLNYYVQQHNDEGRDKAGGTVNRMMKRHAKQTSDPIMEHAPHPISGINWNLLLIIAMRGDFKRRKQQLRSALRDGMSEDEWTAAWKRYNDERAASEAAGAATAP